MWTEVWAALTTIGAAVFAYLWYRRKEVVDLAVEVYEAAKDKTVTEEEFQKIADKLGKVLYKK